MLINIFGEGIAGVKNEFFGTKCRKIGWLLLRRRRQMYKNKLKPTSKKK